MKVLKVCPEDALLMRYSDDAEIAYMQSFPFLSGPQRHICLRVLDRVQESVAVRKPAAGCDVQLLTEEDAALQPGTSSNARDLLERSGLNPAAVQMALSTLAWKFHDVPADARAILDIGCCGGVELAFLRAKAPAARILALDFRDSIAPGLKDTCRVEFVKCNFLSWLSSCQQRFDVIFSNHVLEHMYDPDATLSMLRRRLNAGGILVSALPLDGSYGMTARLLARISRPLAMTDCGDLDFGHPWKTTASDLHETMLRAGFSSVRLCQRATQVSAGIAREEADLGRRRALGAGLRRAVFGSLGALVCLMFGRRPPQAVINVYYALERRFWFGANNLKNSTSPEILAVAHSTEVGIA